MRALQVVLVNELLTVREEEAVNYLSAREPLRYSFNLASIRSTLGRTERTTMEYLKLVYLEQSRCESAK